MLFAVNIESAWTGGWIESSGTKQPAIFSTARFVHLQVPVDSCLLTAVTASATSEYRPGSGHQQYGPSPAMSTRGALPPTPPMQSESGFDGRQSPSVGSTSGYSVASAPGYYFSPPSASTMNNVEPHPHRQQIQTMPQRRVSMPAATIAYTQSPFNGAQYTLSPSQQSMSAYYSSPMQQTPAQSQISGLYYQRPLPQVCLHLHIIY